MKVLIIEGSQSPPTFIQNLIIGLLGEGVKVTLVGRDSNIRFTPINTKNFSRIITSYRSFNTFRILFSLGWIFITDYKAFKVARKYLSDDKGKKLKFKNWCTFSKIMHQQPDIIHFQWVNHLEVYENLIADKRFKVIVSLRGRHINVSPKVDPQVAALYRRVFPKVDGFHAVSQAIVREGSAYGIDENKAQVIYSVLNPTPRPSTKKYSTSSLRLITVGRFHWKKGYTYLLDALALLITKGMTVELTLIAQGEMPEEILYQLEELKLKDQVTWIKGLPHKQVLEQMQQHDVLILPSIEEGIANVVLEAMQVGLPVISTDCGGIAEVIEDGVNGFIVSMHDVHALADSIERFSALSDEIKMSIQTRAYSTITTQFDPISNVKAFEKFYHQVSECASE
jgi:glycosyltransferase involved in cell wall biosynthesis